jgi:UTP:GlnB (protein PII) uridylyltransferase
MKPSFFDKQVRQTIERHGPAEAFRRLIESSDALLRGCDLDHGLEMAAARSATYTGLMGHWATEQQKVFGYDRPFAVVALGGTGREEMTPCSDTDFAFLFDDAIEGNHFLLELQQQVLHTDAFRND